MGEPGEPGRGKALKRENEHAHTLAHTHARTRMHTNTPTHTCSDKRKGGRRGAHATGATGSAGWGLWLQPAGHRKGGRAASPHTAAPRKTSAHARTTASHTHGLLHRTCSELEGGGAGESQRRRGRTGARGVWRRLGAAAKGAFRPQRRTTLATPAPRHPHRAMHTQRALQCAAWGAAGGRQCGRPQCTSPNGHRKAGQRAGATHP